MPDFVQTQNERAQPQSFVAQTAKFGGDEKQNFMSAADHYIKNDYEAEKQNENKLVCVTETINSSSDNEQIHAKKSQKKIKDLKEDSPVNERKSEGSE